MLIERVRRYTDLSLLGGFGISNREQAASVVAAGADGVASGSAFAKIEKSIGDPAKSLPKISALLRDLKEGCLRATGCGDVSSQKRAKDTVTF